MRSAARGRSADNAAALRHVAVALSLGLAAFLAFERGAVAQAPPTVAQAPADLADKATMDRDREISRHLSAAERERARKLLADGFTRGQAGDFPAARAGFEAGLTIDPANAQ